MNENTSASRPHSTADPFESETEADGEAPCRRVFLGWDTLTLPAAATRLLERGPEAVSKTAVCVAGARSGRRLLELLVDPPEGAPAFSPADLEPPLFCTPRQLTERLLPPAGLPLATDLEAQLAWAAALDAVDPAIVERVFPDGFEGEPYARFEAGVRLFRLRRELGGEGLSLGDVDPPHENERWEALTEMERAYERQLQKSNREDSTLASRRVLGTLPLDFDAAGPRLNFTHVVLLGLAEVGSRLRQLLSHHGLSVESWIAAPDSRADDFDGFGAVRAARWANTRLPVSDSHLHFSDDPRQLALRLVDRLAANSRRGAATSIDRVTVGLADPTLAGVIDRTLTERGLATHDARGQTFSSTGPAELMRRASAYGRSQSFEDFAILMRHPDLIPWIETETDSHAERFYAELDRYQEERLPAYLRSDDTHPWPWTAPLLTRATALGDSKALREWGPVLLDLLRFVYGNLELDPARASDSSLIEGLSLIRKSLIGWNDLPETGWRGTDALRLLLHSLDSSLVPDPDRGPAIELVGWLELPLDDAEIMLVTGISETSVPGTPTQDVFLPDRLRASLGLTDRLQRFARDAYSFSVIENSHPNVEWFVSRRGLDGSPLFPSRLLLAEAPSTVAKRWLRFASELPEPGKNSGAGTTIASSIVVDLHEPPQPRPDAKRPDVLYVTAFRDYLGCPYRFYLRHIERVRHVHESQSELDGAAFGSFIHDVLHAFGEEPSFADCDDPIAIRKFLDAKLDQLAQERWGKSPLAAVRLQVELARERLASFAQWQAAHVHEGWRIECVEASVKEQPWPVDDQPFALAGRIDRIDRHRDTGHCLIIDYKTSDKAKTPEQTHRKKDRWVDLQLPLYRHLCEGLGYSIAPAEIQLAYLSLPRQAGLIPLDLAAWDATDYAEADECARDVVRSIRLGKFWPPAQPPPSFSEMYTPIVQDGRLMKGHDDDLADEFSSKDGDSE